MLQEAEVPLALGIGDAHDCALERDAIQRPHIDSGPCLQAAASQPAWLRVMCGVVLMMGGVDGWGWSRWC